MKSCNAWPRHISKEEADALYKKYTKNNEITFCGNREINIYVREHICKKCGEKNYEVHQGGQHRHELLDFNSESESVIEVCHDTKMFRENVYKKIK